VGLRNFLNADHYSTTDTITQYDRYLRDLEGMGNVTPSVVVVSLDGFVDWATRTVGRSGWCHTSAHCSA
jgi:hypothetical protein